jgi:hypothetical protein
MNDERLEFLGCSQLYMWEGGKQAIFDLRAPDASLWTSPDLTDTGTQRKKEDLMEAKKREHPVYTEQYKSQAVEMVIHSGKSVVQIAREQGGSCGISPA